MIDTDIVKCIFDGNCGSMRLSSPTNCRSSVKNLSVLRILNQLIQPVREEHTLRMIDQVSRDRGVLEAISRQHKSAADAKAVWEGIQTVLKAADTRSVTFSTETKCRKTVQSAWSVRLRGSYARISH